MRLKIGPDRSGRSWPPARRSPIPATRRRASLHPFTGLDHMLAMVGVGLWAAFLAGRKPVIAVAVPARFRGDDGDRSSCRFCGHKTASC